MIPSAYLLYEAKIHSKFLERITIMGSDRIINRFIENLTVIAGTFIYAS